MGRILRRVVALATATALLFSPAASADWLPIEKLGDIRQTGVEHTLVANERGDAIAVWKDGRGIRVAVSRRGGAFGDAREVPGDDGLVSGVGADLSEDGRALIYWRRFNTSKGTQRGYVAGLKVDGGFGTTRAVTPAAEYLSVDFAIGPGGRFTIVYSTGTRFRPTYARSAPPSGELGQRRKLATGAISVRDIWYLGLHPYLAWTRGADDYSKLFERRIDPFGSARQIASLPRNGILALDTASNGTQAAVWTSGDTEGPKRPLRAAVRRAGGVFEGERIARRLPPQVLDVAVARSGAALVSWRDFNESTTEDTEPPPRQAEPGRVVTSYRPAGGSFRAKRSFRPDTVATDIRDLGGDITSDGLAVLGFAAVRYEGIVGRPYVVVIDEGGDPDIKGLGKVRSSVNPARVAIDRRSRAVASWVDEQRVRGMRGDFGD